ncbi:hypothetical protein Dsin_020530 [Dipteronia sinensis]|uniref:Uncharacterized protein n=1 Tax=Dipteronia sinensis TaxID=43782 RepID=A0AAE0AA30_9ROSI|nr:hypothetical protein Dsin_020530 [Dipteronia sinensis]
MKQQYSDPNNKLAWNLEDEVVKVLEKGMGLSFTFYGRKNKLLDIIVKRDEVNDNRFWDFVRRAMCCCVIFVCFWWVCPVMFPGCGACCCFGRSCGFVAALCLLCFVACSVSCFDCWVVACSRVIVFLIWSLVGL